ncbi:MAG TPA: hypothetical protein VKU61_01620 [Candidatus Binatia bacterium]|nr:hypothetical protein [Candidatus Binatia bacterium]
MTRLGAALVVLLALAAAGRADEPRPSPSPSTLAIAEPTWDAGKVVRGTTLSHAFVLKNVGTAELSIDAKPG